MTTPGYGGPAVTSQSGYAGVPAGEDPSLLPGQYPGSLFGAALPQGTGAPGSAGAMGGSDPTNQPGQLTEGLSGTGPADTAATGAPGSAGSSEAAGGPDTVKYTQPGSWLTGTYVQGTVSDSVSGTADWTQSHDGQYGGGPQLPGIAGNMPDGTGAGGGRVMRGGRSEG